MLTTLEHIYKTFLKHPVISTDTRNIKPESIFWALTGENFNGNDFVFEALEKGAAFAVTDNSDNCRDERVFLVTNALKTLQDLASLHRKKLKTKIIGITGTNGKTTTKELIREILSQKYVVNATKGNFNNHIGVPLTILSTAPDCEFLILEMGANHPGEIAELCIIGGPQYGIITNIGKAHLEGFQNIETIVKTKKALYDYVGSNGETIFVNSDNKLLCEISGQINKVTYGTNNEAYCKVAELKNSFFTGISWIYKNIKGDAVTNLAGSYNFENISAAVCIGLFFNVSNEQIINALRNYKPANNRSQFSKTDFNELIIDCYNANPASMSVSIKSFAEADFNNKVLILGDMLELGAYCGQEHQKIIDIIMQYNFKKVILVGNAFTNTIKPKDFITFTDTDSAYNWLNSNKLSGNTILIKGSRGIKLEKLLSQL